jgi:hypothetical protein
MDFSGGKSLRIAAARHYVSLGRTTRVRRGERVSAEKTMMSRLRTAANRQADVMYRMAIFAGKTDDDGVFPAIPACLDDEDKTPFTSKVRQWLTADASDVGQSLLLSSPLGSGKTSALAILQKSLRREAKEHKVVDLVLSLRDTNLVGTDLIHGIPQSLGIQGDFSIAGQPIRLLALDGLDEVLAAHGTQRVFARLNDMLDRLAASIPRLRVILSCRDSVLALPNVRSGVEQILKRLPRGRRPDGLGTVESLRLMPWTDKFCRAQLVRLLKRRPGADSSDPAARVEEVLGQFELTSPLLFQLAFDLLRPDGRPPPSPIRTERDLVSSWVNALLFRHAEASLVSPAMLRRTSENVSLYLVTSGIGMHGVTLDELSRPALSWITEEFRRAFESDGAEDGAHREERWKLMLSRLGLLSCPSPMANGGPQGNHPGATTVAQSVRLAPFHSRIMEHLAMGAMDRLSRAGNDTDGLTGPAPPASPATSLPFLAKVASEPSAEAYWDSIGRRMGRPNLAGLHSLLAAHLAPSALDPLSSFRAVVEMWADSLAAEDPVGRPSPAEVTLVPPVPKDRAPSQALAAAIQLRDALDRRIGPSGHTPSSMQPTPPTLRPEAGSSVPSAIRVAGVPLVRIPPGDYPVYHSHLDGIKGVKLLAARVPASPATYLSTRLVTVGEYATFLNDPANRATRQLPQEGSWRRLDDGTAFYPPEKSHCPVTGIGYQDARDYCSYLNARIDRRARPVGTFRLPTADELRIAVGGTELRPPQAAFESGPFGHEQLVCEAWQWTDERRLFGGSNALGWDDKRAVDTLVQAYPNLTADPVAISPETIGLRLAFRLGPDESRG